MGSIICLLFLTGISLAASQFGAFQYMSIPAPAAFPSMPDISSLASMDGGSLLKLYKAFFPDSPFNFPENEAMENLKQSVMDIARSDKGFQEAMTPLSIMSNEHFSQQYLTAQPPPETKNHIPNAPIQEEVDHGNSTTANETVLTGPSGTNASDVPSTQRIKRGPALPASVDWRTKGYITPVKNQGMCGSCWIFSAVAAMEAYHFKATGKLTQFSEQTLLECVTPQVMGAGCSCNQCNGGWYGEAWYWVIKNGGINTEAKHPYTGKPGPCKYDAKKGTPLKIETYDYVVKGDEAELAQVVANIGPVSSSIDANEIKNYKGGIVSCPKFTSTNHAILIVGYGVEKSEKFWIVKNSWGDKWGEKGYLRVAKDKNNACGIALNPNYPVSDYKTWVIG